MFPGVTGRHRALDAELRAQQAQAAKKLKDQQAQDAKFQAICQVAPQLLGILARSNQHYESGHRPFIVDIASSQPALGVIKFDLFLDDLKKAKAPFAPIDPFGLLRRNESEEALYKLQGSAQQAHLGVEYNARINAVSVKNHGLKDEQAVAACQQVLEVLAQTCLAQDSRAVVAFKFESIEKTDAMILAHGLVGYVQSSAQRFTLTLPKTLGQEADTGLFIRALAQSASQRCDGSDLDQLVATIGGAIQDPMNKKLFHDCVDKAKAAKATKAAEASGDLTVSLGGDSVASPRALPGPFASAPPGASRSRSPSDPAPPV